MECMSVAGLVDSWEQGRLPDRRELEEARSHAALCPSCGSRFGALLVLASRDAADGNAAAAPSEAAERIAGQVMAGIGNDPIRRSRPVAFPLAAAAALAVFIAAGAFLAQERSTTMVVRFTLDAPDARSVQLAGSFSGWNSEGLRLKQTDGGVWEIAVRLKRGRSYAYNFLVDGESWVMDPAATDRIGDDFGGESALLRL